MSDDQAQTSRNEAARTRWGRARFGGRNLPALAVAIPAGLLLAVALGVLAVATGAAGPQPAIGGITITFVSFSGATGLVYALVVDRHTIQGATDRPEDSVETSWFDTAARGGFTDTVTFVGLALLALTVTSIEVSGTVALLATLVFALVAASVRYLIARRRA